MEETNPYMALRAQKIARNEARLKELGLLRRTAQVQAPRPKKVPPPVKRTSAPLRRSSRHSGRPETYLELPDPKRRKLAEYDEQGQNRATEVTPEQTEKVVQTFPAHSSRAMDIDVENLVLGGLLGNMMERTGKAFVMEEAARRCGMDVNNISFNKYSGVQEWKNDALFLWVNLGNGGEVVNDFLDSGRQVRCRDPANACLVAS